MTQKPLSTAASNESTGTLTTDRVALAALMEDENWDGVKLFAAAYQKQYGETQLRRLFEAVQADHHEAWSHYQARLPLVDQQEQAEPERER